jgi:hypothetical protein
MDSPEENEKKINRLADAWGKNAAAASFGGMTLAQFQATVKPSLDRRKDIADLDAQRVVLVDQRDDADKISMPAAALVIKGIAGDPAYGTDSALYEACGYVRDSERKTGLTRKKSSTPPKSP